MRKPHIIKMKTQLTPKQKEFVQKYFLDSDRQQSDDNSCFYLTILQMGDLIIKGSIAGQMFCVDTQPLDHEVYIQLGEDNRPEFMLVYDHNMVRFLTPIFTFEDTRPENSVVIKVTEDEYNNSWALPLDVVNQRLGAKFVG